MTAAAMAMPALRFNEASMHDPLSKKPPKTRSGG